VKLTNKWKKQGIQDICGIDIMNEVKYLGIKIGFNKNTMKK
jgi:hypothetical protein